MNSNLNPSDRVAVLAAIDPDATSPSTVATSWIPAVNFYAMMAVIAVGTLGTSATVDAKFEQATDGSGTGVKDITGKAITQLTQADTDDSDKQAIINLFADDLDTNDGFTHVRLSITVAEAASDVGGFVLGLDPRKGEASENDAASVAEIV